MDTRRDFIKKASMLSGGAGLLHVLPTSVAKALAINPAAGSTYLDAEHIVLLMQENRSFDHTYGTLQGVRGFNDPRAINLPGGNPVWLQTNRQGESYLPFRYDIKDTKITWMSSLPHSWTNQVDARNNGRYDKWLDAKPSGHKEWAAMPLTMGYYSRQDIPFYFSLADAFTVCDQNFCSSLTGTTPNRLYFWTGTIREKADAKAMARVWNEDADYGNWVNWKTFPERLEDWGVSWKIYQNELSVGVGFQGEEDAWLANFGDNPIEYFSQYNVKLHPEHIAALPIIGQRLKDQLKKREDDLTKATAADAEKIKRDIDWIKRRIVANEEDQKNYTKEKWNALSAKEKAIHEKAFATNRNDPDYHKLTKLSYKDGGSDREVEVPKGDVLHQFRKDVEGGKLPTVSWLVAPENYSDHPGAAWYGAWYISEVMDILTKNPEVWKKTIFILTYDENDGYFDHVPPFVAPHPDKKETGAVSAKIDSSLEYVANDDQQSKKKTQARESSIGLGYRVPMVIASPWSRGGWVNSQVFDHTSSLQFLEKFLSHKTGKKIEEPNISEWRRTVCGDISSVFRPYNGEKINNPDFLSKNEFIQSIHQAQFKNPPSDFKKLSEAQIQHLRKEKHLDLMPSQEKGTRSSCALPYELYADGVYNSATKSFDVTMKAGDTIFGSASSGSPFHIYAPGKFRNENVHVRSYAVAKGDALTDSFALPDFEHELYHLQVYGPNGFFREFLGKQDAASLVVSVRYEQKAKKLTGNLIIELANKGNKNLFVDIIDNAYKNPPIATSVAVAGRQSVVLNTQKSFTWYDVSIKIKDTSLFESRYAGHVETGQPSKTDPLMGRAI